jgi:homogentisate 1,2-dioxygenase
LRDPIDARGEYEVRVTSGTGTRLHRAEPPVRRRRLGRVLLSVRLQRRRIRADHGQAASAAAAHATFEAPGAAFCVFVPRLFDYHPLAIPVPYNHSSVDCDEVLYYVSGNFMSRRGIEEGSITLHAAGAPHGPQPGAVENSLGKTSTDELASWSTRSRPSASPKQP